MRFLTWPGPSSGSRIFSRSVQRTLQDLCFRLAQLEILLKPLLWFQTGWGSVASQGTGPN